MILGIEYRCFIRRKKRLPFEHMGLLMRYI